MNEKLVLLSNDPDDETFAKEVAKVAGLTFEKANNSQSFIKNLAAGGVRVGFVAIENDNEFKKLEEIVKVEVGLFSDLVGPNTVHLISPKKFNEIPALVSSPLYGNLITRNYGDPLAAGKHFGRILLGVSDGKSFNMPKFFQKSVKTQKIEFANTGQKQQAVEAVKNYLLAGNFTSRIAALVANAIDELIMNAMFDAPVDEMGNHIHLKTSRAESFPLEGKSKVELNIGFDGKYVVISVVDFFGSLNKAKLFDYLSKVYKEEEYKVKMSVAGAGIGLSTVYQRGASLLFISESQVKTEVITFFKKTDNFKTFREQFNFICTRFSL